MSAKLDVGIPASSARAAAGDTFAPFPPSASLEFYDKRFLTEPRKDQFRQDYQPDGGAVDRTFATVVLFPDGDAQVTGCHRPRRCQGRDFIRDPATEAEKERIELNRARREIHTVVKYFRLDHLGTLTYRGAMVDRQRLVRDRNKFERLVRRHLPGFVLLAVPELHQGGGVNHGGYHLHFAFAGFVDVKLLRWAWWKVVGVAQGNVDVQSRCAEPRRKLANYLCKYICKELADPLRRPGEHRYYRSRELSVPRKKMVFHGGRGTERESALRAWLVVASGKKIAFEWHSEDGLEFVFKTFT